LGSSSIAIIDVTIAIAASKVHMPAFCDEKKKRKEKPLYMSLGQEAQAIVKFKKSLH